MADAGPQNKDRIWAFRRQVNDLRLAILGLERDIESHKFEIEFANQKIEDLRRDIADRQKSLDALLQEK